MRQLVLAACLTLASTPAFAADAAPAAPDDITIGLSGGLADTALQFAFRVTPHVAWSFDLGVAWYREIGVAAGVGLQYFVEEDQDFRGFYVGFGGQVASYIDQDAGVEDEVVDAAVIGAFFGQKWVFGGFTVDARFGPALAYRSETDTVAGVEVTTTTLAPRIDSRLVLGWTF